MLWLERVNPRQLGRVVVVVGSAAATQGNGSPSSLRSSEPSPGQSCTPPPAPPPGHSLGHRSSPRGRHAAVCAGLGGGGGEHLAVPQTAALRRPRSRQASACIMMPGWLVRVAGVQPRSACVSASDLWRLVLRQHSPQAASGQRPPHRRSFSCSHGDWALNLRPSS